MRIYPEGPGLNQQQNIGLALLFVIVVHVRLFPFPAYSLHPAFLPMLEAPLQLTFWNGM